MKPESFQYISEPEPAQDGKTAASNPESQDKSRSDHDKFQKKARNQYHQDPCGGCVHNIANLLPTGGETPRMIKPEKGKDDVPDNEETDKEYKINNFDPHGKELFKGN